MRIQAAVSESTGAPFAIQEIELGEPRPDEVLVAIASVGVCHTDVLVRDQWYPVPLPAVLGHEGAGTVTAVGDSVWHVAPGDRVMLSFDSCGHCSRCLRGQPTYCSTFFAHNFGGQREDGSTVLSRNGEVIHSHFFGQSAYATHAVVSARSVVKLDSDAPFATVAPLGCGLQTGAGAVLNSLRPPAGSSIAIFGVGGVGMAAVMAAGIAGCTTIVAVDLNENRLALAAELGATHTLNTGKVDVREKLVELTRGGVNYAIDTTGSVEIVRQAAESTAPLGATGVIGASRLGTELVLDHNDLLGAGRTIRGIVEGDSLPALFLPQLVEHWRQGRFPIDRIIKTYDFEQINEAIDATLNGSVIKPVLNVA
jgi:aryl-alcohol dehydrogenase